MREILQSMMILIVNVGKNILSENDQQLCMTSAPDTAVNPVSGADVMQRCHLDVGYFTITPLPFSDKRFYPTFTIRIIIDRSSSLTTNPRQPNDH